jgi:uncharacterized protein (DUF2336 family)
MLSAPSLIDELETTMRQGSGAQRAEMLQRVTQLFLQNVGSYSDQHVALFDDVMSRLIEQIEHQALIRLSSQLAPIGKPPMNVVHHLARHDNIDISRPIIRQSPMLTDEFLVEIAQSKSQEHLAAIADRSHVAAKVTDVLVERGNAVVTLKVAKNAGARFTKAAFLKVATRANENEDESLAETIANRQDVPSDVFEHLLNKATDVVRQRLLKNAGPEMRTRINETLAAIATQVAKAKSPLPAGKSNPLPSSGKDGHAAITLSHQDLPRLRAQIGESARSGDRTETIEMLSSASKLPVKTVRNLLRAEAEDGVLILCKAIGLGWADVKNVLVVMAGETDTKQAFSKYRNLTEDTAHRVIRFVKSCKAISKADLQRML